MNYLGHRVFIYDPFKGFNEIKVDVDVVFICVDEFNLDNAVQTLVDHDVKGLFVIRSTVPIGTTRRLMDKHKRHICHNPEFLRQATAFEDVLNPDRIVIGKCCDVHGEFLRNLYAPLDKPIFVTTPGVSEVVKLVSNAYLSMLISFWNEIYMLVKKLGLDIKEVAEIVCADRRMSRYGTLKFGEPFGGKCLPKDLNHLIDAFHKMQLTPVLLYAVKKVNEEIAKWEHDH